MHAVLDRVSDAIVSAITNDEGVETQCSLDSQLSYEVSACTNAVAQHFLGELPKHCTMLVTTIADGYNGLHRLELSLPFSNVVVARGLLEAAAELYWLSDTRLDARERTRRAFLVYLTQQENTVLQLEQYAKRGGQSLDRGLLREAISEGWAALHEAAHSMASAGYELRTTKKLGNKYLLDDPKPSVGELVDTLLKAFYGETSLNLYSLYSSVVHAEGQGLGTLLQDADFVDTKHGRRYRYGFTKHEWVEKVGKPTMLAGQGAVLQWIRLCHPKQRDALKIQFRTLGKLL